MAFNFLQGRLTKTLESVKGKNVVDEQSLNDFLSEIRVILLDSDVNINVVDNFLAEIKTKLLEEIVSEGKTKSQYILDTLFDELVKLLGSTTKNFNINKNDVIMFVGLQGSGKTTSAAKLAHLLKKSEKFENPLLVGLDVYRPAAIDQLEKLAKTAKVSFYSDKNQKDPLKILREAIGYAKFNNNDLVILDTAGRLQTDDLLMDELAKIKNYAKPSEVIFIADAMSGQELINVAREFNNKVSITSAIVTKLDSDTKGGAIFSLVNELNIPIQYTGIGEKLDDLEKFHPDRIASRILGLGDIKTLTEKAQDVSDESKNEKMFKKILQGKYDLGDLLDSMGQIAKMGSVKSISKLLPNAKLSENKAEQAQEKLYFFKILINSMTEDEKKFPNLLKQPTRKKRVLIGSGRDERELNTLFRDFERSKKQMKEMAKYIKQGKLPDQFKGMV